MPRKATVTEYCKEDKYPPIFLINLKQTSKSRMVPHRESFWKKKACKAWEKLSSERRKKWFDKDKTMKKTIRCTAGPTWLFEKCTNLSEAEFKRAKKYYRKHKIKGECLTEEQFRTFGCKKKAQKLYTDIRNKNYANRNQIETSMEKRMKIVTDFDVAKQWLIYYRDKLTTKNLKEDNFWVYWDGWLESAEIFQNVVQNLENEGGYLEKHKIWYENFHQFADLLFEVVKPFMNGNFDTRELSNYKLLMKSLHMIRGYPEKKPNAWKVVRDFLSKKHIYIILKKGGSQSKIPTSVGVSSSTPKKKSSSSTPILLKSKKKATPPPKPPPPAPKKPATFFKNGKAISFPTPLGPVRGAFSTPEEKKEYIKKYYDWTKTNFNAMTVYSVRSFHPIYENWTTSFPFWIVWMGRRNDFFTPTMRKNIKYWMRVSANWIEIWKVLGGPDPANRLNGNFAVQQRIFKLLVAPDAKDMDLEKTPPTRSWPLIKKVIQMLDEQD